MRAKYHIQNSFSLTVLANHFWACTLQPGFVVFYKDTFLDGTQIPLYSFAQDLLDFLDICPSQLTPNGWRLLMGVAYLWPQYYGYELTLQEFF